MKQTGRFRSSSRPERWRIIEEDVRSYLMRRFPYAIYYRAFANRAHILGFRPHSRHPDYWLYRFQMNSLPNNSSNQLASRLSPGLIVLSLLALLLSCRQPPPAVKDAVSPTPAGIVTPVQYPSPIIGKTYRSRGLVKIINLKEGWIEIDHQEIPGLMPAMEMEFWVKDKSLLNAVRVGDYVDFGVVETGKGEYLTEIKKSSTVP
jgi:Cu/Ag efflux protein CusF